MNKQLLKLLMLVVFPSMLFIGCNDDEGPTSIDPDRIARFLDGAPQLVVPEESDDIIEIPVYTNYAHTGPVSVFFEIEGDAANYELISDPNVAVIPADERTGVILIKAVDNDDVNLTSNSIVIRITGADSDFGLPSGLSIGHAEKVVVFEDDECPFPSATFVGSAVADFGGITRPVQLSGDCGSSEPILVDGDSVGLTSESPGGPLVLIFEPNSIGSMSGNISLGDNDYYIADFDVTLGVTGGGTYDVATGTIILSLSYTNGGAPFVDRNITIQ